MKLILETHNLSLTDAIKDHVNSRVEKLEHLDPLAIDARVILEHDTTNASEKQFKCSIRLSVKGPDLFAEDSELDLYSAIDLSPRKSNSRSASVTVNSRRATIAKRLAAKKNARKPRCNSTR